MLGIATLNFTGLSGAVFQMTAHGLAAALMFLIVGILYQRTHSQNSARSARSRERRRSSPSASPWRCFLPPGCRAAPASSLNCTSWSVAMRAGRAGSSSLSLGVLVSAAYALRVVGRLCIGPRQHRAAVADLDLSERFAAGLLLAGIVVAGALAGAFAGAVGSFRACAVAAVHELT